MIDISKRGRGRPKKENARRNNIHIRLNDEEQALLNIVCMVDDLSVSEFLRTSANRRYSELVAEGRRKQYE